MVKNRILPYAEQNKLSLFDATQNINERKKFPMQRKPDVRFSLFASGKIQKMTTIV